MTTAARPHAEFDAYRHATDARLSALQAADVETSRRLHLLEDAVERLQQPVVPEADGIH